MLSIARFTFLAIAVCSRTINRKTTFINLDQGPFYFLAVTNNWFKDWPFSSSPLGRCSVFIGIRLTQLSKKWGEIRFKCDPSHESTQIQWLIASPKVISCTEVAQIDTRPVAHDTYTPPTRAWGLMEGSWESGLARLRLLGWSIT